LRKVGESVCNGVGVGVGVTIIVTVVVVSPSAGAAGIVEVGVSAGKVVSGGTEILFSQ
jgi:hypothetical protein